MPVPSTTGDFPFSSWVLPTKGTKPVIGDVSTPVRSGGRLDHLKEKPPLAEGGERWATAPGLMRGEGMVPRLCPLMVLCFRGVGMQVAEGISHTVMH